MSPLTLLHVIAAAAVALCALAGAVRAHADRDTQRIALAGALAAVATFALGVLRQPAFEAHTRRATYLVSVSAGRWSDHTTDLGFAACSFAVAMAFATFSRDAPAWLRRALAALALAFAIAAFAADAYVHARAPNALVREVPRFS